MFLQVIYKNGIVKLINLRTVQSITYIKNRIILLTPDTKPEDATIQYSTPEQAKESFDEIMKNIGKHETIILH